MDWVLYDDGLHHERVKSKNSSAANYLLFRGKPLTIITKRSILNVAAALDPPLLFGLFTNHLFIYLFIYCNHLAFYDGFSILTLENKKLLLELKGSLIIRRDNPSWNRNISRPLHLFNRP